MDVTNTASARSCLWPSLLCGLIFGFGLGVSQMVDPDKVLGFLDVAGRWDPSLMFVMGGALLVAGIGFRWVLRRPAPRFSERFRISALSRVDAPLLGGAALFGIGWGLAGYCPGPAVASLGFGNTEALWLVPAMLAGAGLQRWQARRRGAGVGSSHEPGASSASSSRAH